jgi:hypothetical protein
MDWHLQSRRDDFAVLYAFEAIVLVALLWRAYRIMRRHPADTLFALAVTVLGWIGAWLFGWASLRLASGFSTNLIVQYSAAAVAGTLAFAGISYAIFRLTTRDGITLLAAWRQRWTSSPWRLRLISSACAGIWLACIGLLLFVVLNLAVLSSLELRGAVMRGTMVAKALLLSEPQALAPMNDQATFLERMQRGFSRGVDAIGSTIGARSVADQVSALREILALPGDERAALIETIPELRRLATNQRLIAAATDEHVLDLLLQVREGSFAAIYALGDEPVITALFSDQEIIAAVRTVDPVAIMQHVRAGRTADIIAVDWKLADLRTTLDLDATLADDQSWTRADGSLLRWPTGQRYALARTQLTLPDDVSASLRLNASARVTVWLDGVNTGGSRDGTWVSFSIGRGSGQPVRVDVMLDFRTTDAERTCEAIFASTPSR